MISETLEFALRNKVVILFYLGVILFVILNRKRFQFQLKIIALYKTSCGIKLMDAIASRFRELIKLAGYISIGVGFVGMAAIFCSLLYFLYLMFTVRDAPAAIAPVLPGVQIPGVPFYIPLVEGVIAIFFVAVVHEFAHGVVARAHDVKVKNTGVGILGPIFLAFVEPDDEQLRKKSDVVNYSIFAAGPVSNFVLFGIVLLILTLISPIISSAYPPAGISFTSISDDAPAHLAGLQTGVTYDKINNQSVLTVKTFVDRLETVSPGEKIYISNDRVTIPVNTAAHPDNPSKAYLGVNIAQEQRGSSTWSFAVVSWIIGLFRLIGILSLGIGLGNLIPLGPIDGGRMLQQALHKIKGERKGNKALLRLSLIVLIILILLLYPIFRDTFRALTG